MSTNELGQLIDELVSNHSAYVQESVTSVVISNLSFDSLNKVANACAALGWGLQIFDGAEEDYVIGEADNDMGPFRVAFEKIGAPVDTLQILTLEGFSNFLINGGPCSKWWVAGLSERILTRSNFLCPWGDQISFEPSPNTKNPRSLVREHTNNRVVPSDIGLWILRDPTTIFTYSAAFSIWLNASIRAVSRSLASEIDADSGALKLNGNIKISIKFPSNENDLSNNFDAEKFHRFQSAALWVFDNARETESKHVLLATEIARNSDVGCDFSYCFGDQISSSLDSAKIAYQMMMSDLSKDTIKALGDLRKAITEETAKVTDAVRQLVAGVSAALAVGFGLIAARVTTNANPWLINAVMLIVFAYVTVIILSGLQFVLIQRQLRKDWQPKLYRFLPDEDYKKMVAAPAAKSERTFMVAALISSVAVIVVTLIVFFMPSIHKGEKSFDFIEPSSNVASSRISKNWSENSTESSSSVHSTALSIGKNNTTNSSERLVFSADDADSSKEEDVGTTRSINSKDLTSPNK